VLFHEYWEAQPAVVRAVGALTGIVAEREVRPVATKIVDLREVIMEKCGDQFLRKSVISIPGHAEVLDWVLSSGPPYARALEIGTYRGIGAACLAQYCEHVDTIDLIAGAFEARELTPSREYFWWAMNVLDRIELHRVAGNKEKRAVIGALDFDLAFIDGGKWDVAPDFAWAHHCGAVLFHDLTDGTAAVDRNHVFHLVKTLPQDEVFYLDGFALWTP